VVPTALAMLLCNMDRICMSIAIIPMASEFAWPASVQGLVSASFLWGYMATQLLGGSLADKYGAKATMGVAIIWFSAASLIMPFALSSNLPFPPPYQ
jgi:MFS family permease